MFCSLAGPHPPGQQLSSVGGPLVPCHSCSMESWQGLVPAPWLLAGCGRPSHTSGTAVKKEAKPRLCWWRVLCMALRGQGTPCPSCSVLRVCPRPRETSCIPTLPAAIQLLFPLDFWQSSTNLTRRFPSLLQKAVEEECRPPDSVSLSHWKRHCKYIPLHCPVLYLV